MSDAIKILLMKLIFDASGSDAALLSRFSVFFSVLFELDIFKHDWPVDKLGSQGELTERRNWYQKMFEGGLSGNKGHIAARRLAREEMTARVQRILQYIGVMGSDADITALVNSGVVSLQSRKRASRKAAPVSN